MNLKTAKGLALRDVLSEVHIYVHKSKFIYVLFTLIMKLSYGAYHQDREGRHSHSKMHCANCSFQFVV